jgi:DNA topoisomerase-3
MPITLYIAEKPTLGRNLAQALGVVRDLRTHVECEGGQVVVFAEGHLYEELLPDEYDPKFKAWRFEDLPLDIGTMRVKERASVKARLAAIRSLLVRAGTVVHVGDPDNEGQLIVDRILLEMGWKGPTRRLVNFDQTPRGLAKSLAEGLLDNADPRFRGMYEAALARGEMDWRLGMNISRAIGCKLSAAGVRKTVSYGRLQSTVLAIIVARDLERENFKPKTFYRVTASVEGASCAFVDDPELGGYDFEGYLVDESVAGLVAATARGKDGTVLSYERKKVAEKPPLPYDLTSLMSAASSRLNLSVAQVNEIAQKLYDAGITTYPRVACRFLPEDHHKEAGRILSGLRGIPGAAEADPKRRGAMFNTKKTDEAAHHAIVPTGEPWEHLSGAQRAVFEMVAGNYVLQFLPDCEVLRQTLCVAFDGPPRTVWKATGRRVTLPGWKAFGGRDPEDEGEGDIPEFAKGQAVHCDAAEVSRGETKRPPAFTEASIVTAMENIQKFEPDPENRKLLKDHAGIGTPATRGSVVETLVKRGFVEVKKGTITSLAFGREVVSYIPEELRSPALTAVMEGRLEDICAGRLQRGDMLRDLADQIVKWISMFVDLKIRPAGPGAQGGKGAGHACNAKTLSRFKAKGDGRPFWRCSGCGAFFDDDGGKPVMPVKCPACGVVAAARMESRKKPGTFYFRCKSCSEAFADDKGKPGRAFSAAAGVTADTPKAPCPACGKDAVCRTGNGGKLYWTCTADRAHGPFSDAGGKPGAAFGAVPEGAVQGVCPDCGGVAVQRTSAKGNPYWTCMKDRAHGPFADNAGAPGETFGMRGAAGAEQVPCPHCKGVEMAFKAVSKAGNAYWRCRKCGNMADENGKAGRLFGK